MAHGLCSREMAVHDKLSPWKTSFCSSISLILYTISWPRLPMGNLPRCLIPKGEVAGPLPYAVDFQRRSSVLKKKKKQAKGHPLPQWTTEKKVQDHWVKVERRVERNERCQGRRGREEEVRGGAAERQSSRWKAALQWVMEGYAGSWLPGLVGIV